MGSRFFSRNFENAQSFRLADGGFAHVHAFQYSDEDERRVAIYLYPEPNNRDGGGFSYEVKVGRMDQIYFDLASSESGRITLAVYYRNAILLNRGIFIADYIEERGGWRESLHISNTDIFARDMQLMTAPNGNLVLVYLEDGHFNIVRSSALSSLWGSVEKYSFGDLGVPEGNQLYFPQGYYNNDGEVSMIFKQATSSFTNTDVNYVYLRR